MFLSQILLGMSEAKRTSCIKSVHMSPGGGEQAKGMSRLSLPWTGVAWAERLKRAAPRRMESKERLRRLPISPASTPEPSDVEEEREDQEEPEEEPIEPAHVDVARFPLFPRAADNARPILDPADL